jgi:peptidoglycan LD-endopeptidase CwlK
MASRDKNDLTEDVRVMWEKSEQDWRETYPDRPQPFLTATYRSNAEQAKLYAQGRTTPGKKVTNAKPGQSNHNKFPSPAFDIAFKKADGSVDWSEKLFSDFAVLAKANGLQWGGDWKRTKDTPHFERPGLS